MNDTVHRTEHYELQYQDENGVVWWRRDHEYDSQHAAMIAGEVSCFDYAWRVVRVETTKVQTVVYYTEV